MSAVEYGEFRQTKQKQNGADIFYSNITLSVTDNLKPFLQ